MARGTKSRLAALCGCVVALVLLAPAGAAVAAEPAAIEQYVNTLPGVDTTNVGESEPIVARSQRAGPVGVIGERDGSVTALGAIGSATATPGGVVLVAALAAGIGVGFSRRRVRR
jgi:hypothetical protein